MKIMFCGKGGCGKSTLSALLAKELERRENQVLVIDEDESNFGLHRQLGMELPKDFTEYFGGKRAVLHAIPKNQPDVNIFEKSWGLEDIPEEYTSRKGKIRLMSNGKIHHAGEGCACGMGALSKQFLKNLRLKDHEMVIMDMEAGVEHFGRGVADFADVIFMVMDPSYESLKLSEKVTEMAESIHKPIYYVLNKVDQPSREAMRGMIKKQEKIVCVMPSDIEVSTAGLLGKELQVSREEIRELADFLERSEDRDIKEKYVFFDLDGTLTDPQEGITKSVAYALESFGIHVEDRTELNPFIGPPLTDSFEEFYGFTHEQALKGVEKYREYFGVTGKFENVVYDGIPLMLRHLKENGRKLIVATSKPTIYAKQIMEHFHLSEYFQDIQGSELNGDRVRKADVITYAMKINNIQDPRQVIMVGDREHDVIGAAKNGIRTIGVEYGYGNEEELRTAGAWKIAATVKELEEILLKEIY